MTNQEKFIQIFGIDVWQQMIVFSGLAEQFKEYWTSLYYMFQGRYDLMYEGEDFYTKDEVIMGITNEEQQIKAEIEAQLFLKNHNIDYYERATVDAVVLIMEQYEARLKADMVAMLTEILLEIEECGVEDSHWIIKEKINKLKEENNAE